MGENMKIRKRGFPKVTSKANEKEVSGGMCSS